MRCGSALGSLDPRWENRENRQVNCMRCGASGMCMKFEGSCMNSGASCKNFDGSCMSLDGKCTSSAASRAKRVSSEGMG